MTCTLCLSRRLTRACLRFTLTFTVQDDQQISGAHGPGCEHAAADLQHAYLGCAAEYLVYDVLAGCARHWRLALTERALWCLLISILPCKAAIASGRYCAGCNLREELPSPTF